MPRQSRYRSKNKIYHIVSRGNNKQNIFLDQSDLKTFLMMLMNQKKKRNFQLLAYCLMVNHIHLLIKENEDSISDIMKGILTSYVLYFNKKYERVGHLFQGRFRSQAIEDERYFFTVIRYIHNNPIKANLVKKHSDYKWSSFLAYLNPHRTILVDTDVLYDLISSKGKNKKHCFLQFSAIKEDTDIEIIDIDDRLSSPKLCQTKKQTEKLLQKLLDNYDIELNQLKSDRGIRNDIIIELRENSTLTLEEISNLLNIGMGIVARVCKGIK